MQICPGCGEENPDKFRLCGFCGTPLSVMPALAETRKTVTVVFSDLKGSTSLGERLDSEALREVLTRYFDEMKRVLERHGGTVEKFIGDAVMAVFGLPKLHEDDALRAVRAAFDMTQALHNLNRELERRWGVTLVNRTGVNTGEVVAGNPVGGQRLVTGDAVNVAARLEQAAPELEVLIGESTYRLVRDAVEVEVVPPLPLKGKSELVPAYRLISVRSGEMLPRRHDAPLVGREQELAVLDSALDEAAEEKTCRLVTVVAQAGVGKTRLLGEFLRTAAAQARILRGHCLPYGDGITFWPMAEVVRDAAGILEDEQPERARAKISALLPEETERITERLESMVGLSSTPYPIEETFWASRRLLEKIAEERPLVVVFEDIHWAEETFLGLVQHFVEQAQSSSLLILCTTRPELLEDRPDWGEGPAALRIALEPLSPEQSAKVAENLLGGALDEQTRARIAESAEGNPLFVEQMLSMLIDADLLERVEERWVPTQDLSTLAVPPTIQALLAARLDRLERDERAVIEPAAVVGRVFYRGAIEYLTGADSDIDVDSKIGALIRKQFVAPDDDRFAGEEAFRFHHVLIRDAAYQGLLKRSRAELHERFAEWVTNALGPRANEYEEIIAHHVEQAFLYRQELGPLDDHGHELGVRAAELLGAAGRRAFARGDVPAAENLLKRAVTTLPLTDPRRLRLLPDLADVMLEQGEFVQAEELVSEAVLGAARNGDRRLHAEASMVRLVARYATDPDGLSDEVLKETARAISIFEELGDHAGLARAWRLLGQVHGTASQYGEAERAVERTIEHAKLAGDHLLEVRNYPPYAITALHGPTPVPEAMARCEEITRQAAGDRRTEGIVLCALAHLQAMEGNFDEARTLYRRAKAVLDDLGVKVLAASTSLDSGPVEMLAGDPVAAERELRRDHEALTAMGERYLLSSITAYLSQAILAQGREEEAERMALECKEIALGDDPEAQAIWRRVQARILAGRGQFDEAERLAREAVAFVRKTDSPVMQADALVDLGEVLQAGGRVEESAGAIEAALALYEQKGNLVSAERARSLLPAATDSAR